QRKGVTVSLCRRSAVPTSTLPLSSPLDTRVVDLTGGDAGQASPRGRAPKLQHASAAINNQVQGHFGFK
ncbi:unnamed protein product, partial [Gadus morhua 'NCC']